MCGLLLFVRSLHDVQLSLLHVGTEIGKGWLIWSSVTPVANRGFAFVLSVGADAKRNRVQRSRITEMFARLKDRILVLILDPHNLFVRVKAPGDF